MHKSRRSRRKQNALVQVVRGAYGWILAFYEPLVMTTLLTKPHFRETFKERAFLVGLIGIIWTIAGVWMRFYGQGPISNVGAFFANTTLLTGVLLIVIGLSSYIYYRNFMKTMSVETQNDNEVLALKQRRKLGL